MKPSLGVVVAKKLGLMLRDHELITQALTHSSFGNLHKLPSNERLEFMGDAILSAIVAERIYDEFTSLDEGKMTQLRAQTVQGSALAAAARNLGLDKFLQHSIKDPSAAALEHLYEQAFEALIAAVFLQFGYEKTVRYVKNWLPINKIEDSNINFNPKGRLQELLQPKIGVEDIDYKLVKEQGPNHERTFTVELWIKGKKTSIGVAKSKKAAEEAAALKAIKKLNA